MKKLIKVIVISILTATTVNAQTTPKWIRHSAISPDGETIAFSYQGDIYTVSTKGGLARQITTNPAYDSDPLWSEDGEFIIFSSYRELSKDIWRIPSTGGTPKRITTFSGKETPLCCANGKIWFSANIQQDTKYAEFPGTQQLYSVPYTGGKITMESPVSAANLSVNANGIRLYEDIKGYEDELRKHHTSSVTRDIWKYLPKKKSYVKITDFNGEDRNPVFASKGSSSYYYLSERSGSFNVWEGDINNPSEQKQITEFRQHPVRNLSASREGIISFSHNGDIYIQKKDSKPEKLEITLIKDINERKIVRRDISGGISSIAVSPDGKEVAVVAHGDIFVVNPDLNITKRITNTPYQERDVSFSSDGRELYYSAETEGEWGIWCSSITGKQEYFTLEDNFKTERITKSGKTCFQPSISPDGKHIAYLQNRNDLVIRNIGGGKESIVLKDINYSYTDGDLEFEWSPDGKYLLSTYMGDGGWNNPDIALIEVAKGTVTNITKSGYTDHGFHWSSDGTAMYWLSDKKGYRSHGSWGSQDDIYTMFFNGESLRKFLQSEDREKINAALQNHRNEDKKHKEETAKALKINLDNLEDRIVRQTPYSSYISDFISNEDGGTLYFFQNIKGKTCLCKIEKGENQVQIIKEGINGRFAADASRKRIFINGESLWELKTDGDKLEKVNFSSEYDYDSESERKYIFEHIVSQVAAKFYDADIHGINWSAIAENYRSFLPYINNNFDFQELLSELLGELNGSHTGGRYYSASELNTGHIGILWDNSYKGEGLRVQEVLAGSPVALEYPDIREGKILESVDGVKIESAANWYDVFRNKAGKLITLRFKGVKVDVRVEASASDIEALYRRWVRTREEMTERLSGGKVGYVHVRGMDSESFREVFSKALGKYRGCKALVVDTRHNGGGWLTDDLIDFLSGKEYLQYMPRGRYIGSDPFNKWCRPSCVLVGEDNYSDASGFPYAYQSLGIGKLIGAPVPGTMTAVWWERQIDPTLVFGIPQVTTVSKKDGTILENTQIEPDILIYNTPESLIEGRDLQLEAAVKEMLKEIE